MPTGIRPVVVLRRCAPTRSRCRRPARARKLAAGLTEYLRARQERQAAMVQFSRFTNPHVAKQLVESGGIDDA